MKKLFLFVSFVFCVSNIFAQDIDVEAAKDSAFQHIAIEVPGEETRNEWCEPVDEAEYAKLK